MKAAGGKQLRKNKMYQNYVKVKKKIKPGISTEIIWELKDFNKLLKLELN